MIREFTELKVPEENVIRKDQRIRFKVELVNMPFLQEVRRIKMSTTEQEIIKRQLNYYLDKNIDTLKNKFYGKDGIWSRYHKFIDRFKIEDNKIEVKFNKSSRELSLETYCLGLNHKDPNHTDEKNFGAFSWWVEFYLRDLGSVGGTSSGAHGIYYYSGKTGESRYHNSKNKNVDDKTKPQDKFQKETYNCIKNKLGLSTNNGSSEDFECKPKEVVLNKIYYLFNMKEPDTKLIPIFKDKSLDNVIALFDGKTEKTDLNTWEAKSKIIYEQFAGFLEQNQNKNLNLDTIPTLSESDKNKVEYVTNENCLEPTARNLFKSYCFGCFFWSTLENKGGLSDKIDELILRGDKNIILTGAPGTGKTFACQSYAREQVCNFISENSDNLKTVDGNDQSSSLTNDYYIKTVQFHPGYDYSDFIEGIRPKRDDSDGSTIYYDRKDGIFKDFCRQVVNFNEKHKDDNLSKSAKFFFIIDEINRGEVSKIFGEAFSMIETDKRAPVDIESEKVTNKVDTQYSSLIEDKDPFQNGFYIPENVYILATMNEIDRSLEAMDFAFRRRFSWLTVEVQDTLNEIIINSVLDDCTNSVSSCMSEIEKSFNELNGLIKDNLGSDYMLGGSYLTSLKNSSRTKGKTLKEELWNNHLEPIIKDYIKGTDGKIETYKDKFVDSNNEDSKKDPLNEKQ